MLRMKRLAVLWMVIPAAIGCSTYSSVAGKPIAPERRVRVRFSTPITLRFDCHAVDSVAPASASGPGTESCADSMLSVTELSGLVKRATTDTLLVAVASARDSTGRDHRFDPPRDVSLPHETAAVDVRHTDTTRTILLVVGIAATAVVVAAIVAIGNSDWSPSKPTNTGF